MFIRCLVAQTSYRWGGEGGWGCYIVPLIVNLCIKIKEESEGM